MTSSTFPSSSTVPQKGPTPTGDLTLRVDTLEALVAEQQARLAALETSLATAPPPPKYALLQGTDPFTARYKPTWFGIVSKEELDTIPENRWAEFKVDLCALIDWMQTFISRGSAKRWTYNEWAPPINAFGAKYSFRQFRHYLDNTNRWDGVTWSEIYAPMSSVVLDTGVKQELAYKGALAWSNRHCDWSSGCFAMMQYTLFALHASIIMDVVRGTSEFRVGV
ncbi:hypothetical protein B0T25DRAFT_535812 [Lasiosphaeria hispida]|uniref:Uncharacterized protein n=1 Tax=Lasiosphaeria hispida TaxID=260671 RepID=A0AAJ0HSM7_9PEZI|nr:hypothetical protein B0T25DRAFT_535812 [Lasiosphaeria hispida]